MANLDRSLRTIFTSGEVLSPDIDAMNPLFMRHLACYKFCLNLVKDKLVLEIGCGEGYGASLLAKQAKKIIASDLQRRLITYARNKYTEENLEFMVAEATELPFKNRTFEVVVSLQVIEHIKNYQDFLKEIERVLKPEGMLILTTPNRLMMLSSVNPYHYKEWTADELGNALSKFFQKVELSGLFGSEEYMSLKRLEQEKARRILKIDFLGLRRILPRNLLKIAYRLAFLKVNKETDIEEKRLNRAITEEDFYMDKGELADCLELIAIAYK